MTVCFKDRKDAAKWQIKHGGVVFYNSVTKMYYVQVM